MLQCAFFETHGEVMRTVEQQNILDRFNAQAGFSYQTIGLNALQQRKCEDLILFMFIRVEVANKNLEKTLMYLGAARDERTIVRAGNFHTSWSLELTAVEAEYNIFKEAFKRALDPTESPEPVTALMSFLGEFSACLTVPESRPSILPRFRFGFFGSSFEKGEEKDLGIVSDTVLHK